ncbi:hypothetical protein CGRA01v4_10498 [Colletotrichum graminicola]|nr:hypothetical protein CGRA01v4_10498 [Colletotrichum graminicola]
MPVRHLFRLRSPAGSTWPSGRLVVGWLGFETQVSSGRQQCHPDHTSFPRSSP